MIEGAMLPLLLSMDQLLILFDSYLELPLSQVCSTLSILNLHGISTLGDFWTDDNPLAICGLIQGLLSSISPRKRP